MLHRLFDYQIALLKSGIDLKFQRKGMILLLGFFFSVVVGTQTMLYLTIGLVSAFIIYRVINSERHDALPPASDHFYVGNLMLLAMLTPVLCYLLYAILSWALILLFFVIMAAILPSNPPQDVIKLTTAITPNWQDVIFWILLMLIIMMLLTLFSLARSKKIQSVGYSLMIIISLGLFLLLRINTLIQLSAWDKYFEFNDVLSTFHLMPAADAILLIMALVLVVLIPLAYIIGLGLYRRRQRLKIEAPMEKETEI